MAFKIDALSTMVVVFLIFEKKIEIEMIGFAKLRSGNKQKNNNRKIFFLFF